MFDLTRLQENREALLLAEVAAWLHDWQKCIDMAVASHWQKNGFIERTKIENWKNRGKELKPGDFSTILEYNLTICENNISFKELGEQGRQPSKAEKSSDFLIRLLGKSHDIGHIEKELEENENRELATDWLSTSFGYENKQPEGFLEKLLKNIKPSLESFLENSNYINKFLYELKKLFQTAWGDTRRPINEVTLWDWSSIVAALYKAELARCLITGEQREPRQVAWRLLSVSTDGLSYLLGANSIPDLLARKELLTDGWDRVQKLLEEIYPLGLEVYRDENGSIFVVPDIENLTFAFVDDSNNRNLHQLITENFAKGTVKNNSDLRIGGEIIPDIYDEESWNGQLPDGLPPVGKHLKRVVQLSSDPAAIADTWSDNIADICTVCGLRPQGPDKKAANRKVCNICEERRADRAKKWATKELQTTIWIDEVADKNGRIALITGNFHLTRWLSGDLVRSLAVRKPDDQNGHIADKIAKNPSFARLRRIWGTTRRFWQEVAPTDEENNIQDSLVGERLKSEDERLEVCGTLTSNASGDTLGLYHAYDLVLPKGVRLTVILECQEKCSQEENFIRFIVADNLEYIGGENQLGQSVKDVLRKGESFEIEEASGYGTVRKKLGTITLIKDATPISGSKYIPVIPILAEPRTFMALVPAEKAMEIVKEIKVKYEREMGKVRNRLPLHLGIVFSGRRTPLRAIMDAGRQMLKQRAEASVWKVISVNETTEPKNLAINQNGQFARCFKVFLEKDARQITWYVPAMMGDGQTEDHWYPYVFLETDSRPTERNRYFSCLNPWTGRTGWLVHAGELKSGDTIYFTPSTFDFEFLDTTARRFEIHYDENGRRTTRRTRPYYLEDLDRLERLWRYMKKHFSKKQRHQIIRTIESTRQMWFGQDMDGTSLNDDTFKQFVADTLAVAEWRNNIKWSTIEPEWREELILAGVRGELADLFELHKEVLKETE